MAFRAGTVAKCYAHRKLGSASCVIGTKPNEDTGLLMRTARAPSLRPGSKWVSAPARSARPNPSLMRIANGRPRRHQVIMPTSLREKIGVKSGMRCILLHAPEEMAMRVELSAKESVSRLTGAFDYIHFFTTRQGKLRDALQRLKPHLQLKGMLWISWPKARQLSTDLTLPEVIRIAYDAGFVESKAIGIDTTWSAIKLTFPKEGKRYQNSYGQLPDLDAHQK